MFKSLFKKDPALAAGEALYQAAVYQARTERLYAELGAPDTVEGRFEMVALHVFLVLRRLKGHDAAAAKTAQAMLDAFFANMDDSLRELGVGDLAIARKIRKLSEDFYGRVTAYETALKGNSNGAGDVLADALARNVLGSEDAQDGCGLADYTRAMASAIQSQPVPRITAGIVIFKATESEA